MYAEIIANLTAAQREALINLKAKQVGFDNTYREAKEFGAKGAALAALKSKGLIETADSISARYGWDAPRYRLTNRGSVIARRIAA